MNATPTTPQHQALAFAARFTLIIASLMALIARGFLHDPKLAPLILPLCRRLTRTTRHLPRTMALLAAGHLGRAAQRGGVDSDRGAPLAPRKRSRAPRPPIPTTEAWLVRTLHHEAAGYASQLNHLLNEPGVSDLLAAAPTARRLLNPLCRMLGLPPAAPAAAASGRNSEAYSAEPAPPPAAPETQALPPSSWPLAPATMRPPPCPHVGWPWFPRRAKPA